jgi:acyl-CoA synthetase (NDP forming)
MTEQDRNFMLEPNAVALLAKYGVPYPKHRVAKTAQEAMDFADEIGYPVVLKIVSQNIPHKTELGGVIANLSTRAEVEKAYWRIETSVEDAFPYFGNIDGFLVCKQATEGVEVIIGATEDPVFGMTVMFGLGGIFTEVLKDVSFRSVPMTQIDAEEMIQEIRGYPVLTGVRGSEACDLEALAELLVSVSNFVYKEPDVKELDLNPVRTYPHGVLALDARIVRAANSNKLSN